VLGATDAPSAVNGQQFDPEHAVVLVDEPHQRVSGRPSSAAK